MELAYMVAARRSHAVALRKRFLSNVFWYAVLIVIALGMIMPFLWMFLTSFKGPNDVIYSVPPQFIPHDPTFANYIRVWNNLPVASFFLNSILVAGITVVGNVLITSLAAYPFAKMKFKGRDSIFYFLLATYIVPVQLTYIPSYILAVKVFGYYNNISALIFPSLASIFNIFLLRQAFKAVPADLIDAGRVDGAGELRIWWSILLPVVRPSLATVAIITFVNQWNDFLWPSLMLQTMDHKTLTVGLMSLQGMFSSDFRGVAAGVGMMVIPILIFFVALQKYFVRGLTGAVKG
ncbi:MAG: carbohydrate ABC transporter permease [Chloroflexi bacterium]|nr:carbohydrate ABC transporter permease [Chloroflexota bacterium]